MVAAHESELSSRLVAEPKSLQATPGPADCQTRSGGTERRKNITPAIAEKRPDAGDI
jgi:hypothetical protein